jgi:hypothetical protein
MTLLERYKLILEQGLAELGPQETPRNREHAFELQGIEAPRLGDILYRLCIEHGAPFAPFKETIIALVVDPRPLAARPELGGEDAEPFLSDLQDQHPLVLLALEMMPAEAADS